ncbi:Hypothetical protein PSEBR_m847 [Pseudomonas brassicacearum subsp. brassicacearum NFM421]|uniref:Uncharacterized protein n=1 Tax=Pseudomonas brassicacearum (strain NFM421) TaxID=994484 RepID=F2KFY2_PSEBN|nr:Hypothetical protein PSEBR_m847 [Pseudomonas brassicacearum subsp. brassicacearum NFM421]
MSGLWPLRSPAGINPLATEVNSYEIFGPIFAATTGVHDFLWEQSLLAMQAPRFPGRPRRLHRGQALLPQEQCSHRRLAASIFRFF